MSSYYNGDLSQLDRVERGRVSGMTNNIIGSYENACFARDYGVIGDAGRQRLARGADTHYRLIVAAEKGLNYVTGEFKSYLEASCQDAD